MTGDRSHIPSPARGGCSCRSWDPHIVLLQLPIGPRRHCLAAAFSPLPRVQLPQGSLAVPSLRRLPVIHHPAANTPQVPHSPAAPQDPACAPGTQNARDLLCISAPLRASLGPLWPSAIAALPPCFPSNLRPGGPLLLSHSQRPWDCWSLWPFWSRGDIRHSQGMQGWDVAPLPPSTAGLLSGHPSTPRASLG